MYQDVPQYTNVRNPMLPCTCMYSYVPCMVRICPFWYIPVYTFLRLYIDVQTRTHFPVKVYTGIYRDILFRAEMHHSIVQVPLKSYNWVYYSIYLYVPIFVRCREFQMVISGHHVTDIVHLVPDIGLHIGTNIGYSDLGVSETRYRCQCPIQYRVPSYIGVNIGYYTGTPISGHYRLRYRNKYRARYRVSDCALP
jgi:hypothetical protein